MKNRAFILGLVFALMTAGGYSQDPRPAPQKPELVLDVATGEILGAKIGMDEATVRSAMTANHNVTINKVAYRDRFVLQFTEFPGLIFNFRDNKDLDDIYTNSPKVVLSNGLRVGQSTKEFLAKLGQPKASTRLPSGIGIELVFFMNNCELGVIVLDSAPFVAKALTLRKASP